MIINKTKKYHHLKGCLWFSHDSDIYQMLETLIVYSVMNIRDYEIDFHW